MMMMNKLFNFVNIPQLQQAQRIQNNNGTRLYRTPHNKEYPSITTILSATSEKDFSGWIKFEGGKALTHKKLLRELEPLGINPSKNSIEENQKLELFVGTIITNYLFSQSGPTGTKTHELNEDYLQGNQTTACNNLLSVAHHNNLKLYFEKINNIHGIETMLYSDTLQIAGTCDLIAEYDGKLSIIDYKTKRSFRKEEYMEDAFIQGTAYGIMWEEMTNIPIEQIVILVSSEDNTRQEFIKNPLHYITDLNYRVKQYNHNTTVQSHIQKI